MRLLAAACLTLVLLAGCAFPGAEDEEEPDPLFGLCPQWLQAGATQSVAFQLRNATEPHAVELGPADATAHGKPLDLYRVMLTNLSVDGRLELRAFDAAGKQLAVRDYRQAAPQLQPVVLFTDGSAAGNEFEVFLSPITSDGEAAPAPVTLRWTLDGTSADVAFDATFHYKVCGSAG